MSRYYYYILLDKYELDIPRLPNSHHSHCSWYTWPFAYRGLIHALFPRRESGQVDVSAVYFLPNLAVCLASSIATLVATLILYLKRWTHCGRRASGTRSLGSLLAAYGFHLLPFSSVNRETFNLYYVFAFYFGVLLLAAVIDGLAAIREPIFPPALPRPSGTILMCCIVALCGALFLCIWPLSTGDLPPGEFMQRMAAMQPSCWFGECFNAPIGSTLHGAVALKGSERNAFPFLI